MKKRPKAILLLCLVAAGAIGQNTGDMIRAQARVRTKTSKTRRSKNQDFDANNILAWDE